MDNLEQFKATPITSEVSRKGCKTIVSPDGSYYADYPEFSGTCVASVHRVRDSETQILSSLYDLRPPIKFSPDSNAVLFRSRALGSPALCMCNLKYRALHFRECLKGSPTDFDLSADGRFLATVTQKLASTADVVIYNAFSFAELKRTEVDGVPSSDQIRVSFSSGGERLMLSQNSRVRISKWQERRIIWDVISCGSQKVMLTSLNELLFYGGQHTWRKPLNSGRLEVHFDWSSDSVTCSHDSKYIAAPFGNQVRFYDYETGQLKAVILQFDLSCRVRGFIVSLMLFDQRSHNYYLCLEGQCLSRGGQT